jgi:trimeric autotransporter adhesin
MSIYENKLLISIFRRSTMKKIIKPNLPLLGTVSFAISAFLVACGGGGGSSATPTPPSVPTTVTSLTAVDGLIKGAIVCVDANNNGLCDTGETQGTTDILGAVTLNIPTTDVGKYPILAVVPAGAVDADDPTTPIPTGYTLKAPADNSAVISPLTTLVQHQVDSGLTSAQAAIVVQDQTGVANAFANFVATPDTNARVVAKTIVRITQEKLADATITALVGTNDPITGKPITQTDLDAAIRASIIQTLPSVVTAVSTHSQSGGACADPTTAACKTAIASAVTGASGLAAGTGVTATTLGTLVGVAKSVTTQTDSTTPIAGATLKWLKYTDANNYYYRAFVSTLAENTFDANNLRRFRDVRMTATAGTVVSSGGLINQGRTDDVHWNGSAWVVACNNTYQNTATIKDANGTSMSYYCDNYSKNRSTSVKVDFAGKTVADLVTAIRSYPSQGDGLAGVGFAGWGASDSKATTALAAGFSSTAVLPAGSILYYVSTTQTDNAISYIVSGTNISYVPIAPAAVAAGGSSATTPLPACASSYLYSQATSLASLISQNKGTPCVFSPYTATGSGGATLSSGTTNESWDATTLHIGQIGTAALATGNLAANASSFYTGNH